MATEEIKIVVKQEGAQEAANQVNALNNALENTEQAAQNASQGASKASMSFTEMFDSFNEGMDAFKNIGSNVQAAFQEFNRQSGVMRNFSGTITETSERMGGLVSNIQLMESANRIAATGLQLTDHQFGNLTVAAQRYAQATGQDLTQSMEQLSEAISEGSAEQLQRFGLELGNASTKSQVQRNALNSLEEQYGELDAAGNGVTDMFTRMQVASENTTTQIIQTINQSSVLNSTFDRMGETIDHLSSAMSLDLFGGLSLVEGITKAVIDGFSVMIRMLQRFTEGLISLGEADFSEAREQLISAFDIEGIFAEMQIDEVIGDVTRTIADNQRTIEAAVNSTNSARSEGQQRLQTETEEYEKQLALLDRAIAASRQRNNLQRTNELILMREELINERQNSLFQRRIEQLSRLNSLATSLNQLAQLQNAYIENQRIGMQAIFDINQERLEAEDALRQVNFEKERTRQQALAEADRRINDKELEYKRNNEDIIKQKVVDAEEEFQRRRMSNLQTYGSEFSNIVGATIQAGIDGEMKFGKAMRHVIDQWLKKFAIQETLKGASDLASAIGSTIINPPAAATLYASSGKHFAIAAAAGAASLAIPGGKGGGGKGSGAGESGAGPTPSNVPSAPTGRQEPTGVVINVNGMTGATEAQIGRAYENAIRAAQSRY